MSASIPLKEDFDKTKDLIIKLTHHLDGVEKEYNKVLESTTNMKEIERAEKNYFDSLKVLEKFNKLNGYKRN